MYNTYRVDVADLCYVEIYSHINLIIMKKITLGIMTAFLLLTFIPTQLKAGTETSTLSVVPAKTFAPTEANALEANALLVRLDKIKAMDKSMLNSSERKVLRKEVRSIKSQLSEIGGGVYLSVGAIIIIILLLILLLPA